MAKFFITGGAGFLGTHIIKYLNNAENKFIVYSRDEAKHLKLREELGQLANITTIIGDVRDKEHLEYHLLGENPEYVIIAHALKQIKTCQENIDECIKTNIQGTLNVINVVKKLNRTRTCFISTDKAVNPTSIYGTSKKLCEQIITENCFTKREGRYCSVRYGNVLNSTGSVIPLFAQKAKNHERITVHHPDITRFMLDVRQAVYLVGNALFEGIEGIIVPVAVKSYRITDIADFFVEKRGAKEKVVTNYLNPYEKLHETLIEKGSINDMTALRNVGQCAILYSHGKDEFFEDFSSNRERQLMSKENTFKMLEEAGL